MASAAKLPARRWDWASGVYKCETCDGHGTYSKTPWRHANDPDNHVVYCEDCEEQGVIPCAVCGFDVEVSGYDCLVCGTVAEMTPHQMRTTNPADIADAFAAAMAAALDAPK